MPPIETHNSPSFETFPLHAIALVVFITFSVVLTITSLLTETSNTRKNKYILYKCISDDQIPGTSWSNNRTRLRTLFYL